MTVGVKFCGGCNPRYNRAAALRALERDFPQHHFAPAQSVTGPDWLLVLCGCKAACADVSGIRPARDTLLVRDEAGLALARAALGGAL